MPGHTEVGFNDPFGQQSKGCSMAKLNYDAKKDDEKSNASKPLDVKDAEPVHDVNPTKDDDLVELPAIDDKAKSTASIPRAKTASSVSGS